MPSDAEIPKRRNTAAGTICITLLLAFLFSSCQRPSVSASAKAAAPSTVGNGQAEPEFKEGYPTEQAAAQLKDQLLYQ